nr:hypothetical protein [Tanacetum cinerariifolium]
GRSLVTCACVLYVTPPVTYSTGTYFGGVTGYVRASFSGQSGGTDNEDRWILEPVGWRLWMVKDQM